MEPDSDHQLIRQIAQGDSMAAQELYHRYSAELLVYLTGQLDDSAAEEVMQDVMLAVWQGAAKFRGESSVRTWLFSIARYKAINRRVRQGKAELPLQDDLISVQPDETDDVSGALNAALDRLPRDQREALELIFYHGLSGEEAARVMGVPPGTIKSRLHRAKLTLKRWLGHRERKA